MIVCLFVCFFLVLVWLLPKRSSPGKTLLYPRLCVCVCDKGHLGHLCFLYVILYQRDILWEGVLSSDFFCIVPTSPKRQTDRQTLTPLDRRTDAHVGFRRRRTTKDFFGGACFENQQANNQTTNNDYDYDIVERTTTTRRVSCHCHFRETLSFLCVCVCVVSKRSGAIYLDSRARDLASSRDLSTF